MNELANLPAIPAPLALGEDATLFDELLRKEIAEWRPRTPYELLLVQQLADDQWRLLQLRPVRKWLHHAAIADAVHSQLLDAEAAKSFGDLPVADGLEQIGLQIWKSLRKQAFSAVAGNPTAIDFVERQIGPGKMKLSAETTTNLVNLFRTQLLADRLAAAALARCALAYNQLRAMKRDAETRNAPPFARLSPTPEQESLAAYIHSKLTQQTATTERSNIGASPPRHDIPESAPDVGTVHGPSAVSSKVIAPNSGGGDDVAS